MEKRVNSLIKSKKRVKDHGEVFTPKFIVNKMINLEGIKDSIKNLNMTVLEPSVGEGIFLTTLLQYRLDYIKSIVKDDVSYYENLSLLALTTLYGIEILADNTEKTVLNLFQTYYENYLEILSKYRCKKNKDVLESAKTIISANIVQGDFLKGIDSEGKVIIFSEWRVKTKKNNKNIKVSRTEHTINQIRHKIENNDGNTEIANRKNSFEFSDKYYEVDAQELNFLDMIDEEENIEEQFEEKTFIQIYKTVKITRVFREEILVIGNER
ncbi:MULTISPECIES: hypothetical protein [Helcococcus]|uniref:site-specific DNA-methyltransferase (adenine-specific) n=1 Tax=Helcococcus bovis TaxID=3153252 RepID=A0ABW9F434_9FIRM